MLKILKKDEILIKQAADCGKSEFHPPRENSRNLINTKNVFG